jgi:uncharacterized protein (TIGR02246 family)
MKISKLLMIAFVFTPFFAHAQSTARKDQAAIRKADKDWSQAVEGKNLDKTISFYAEDAAVLPFNAPKAVGTQSIRQLWNHLFQSPGFHLQFAPGKIAVARSGDMAYEIGRFELTMTGPGGAPAVTPGKYVVVWKKQNGRWKAVADIFNTDK